MENNSVTNKLHSMGQSHYLQSCKIESLIAASLSGEHVLLVGPHKLGKIQLARAVAEEISKITGVGNLEDASSKDRIAQSLQAAGAAGVDHILAVDISADNLRWLLTNYTNFSIIGTLPSANRSSFWLSFDLSEISNWQKIIDKNIYQLGFDLNGYPDLIGEQTDLSRFKLKEKAVDVNLSPQSIPKSWEQDSIDYDPGWELDKERDLCVQDKILKPGGLK